MTMNPEFCGFCGAQITEISGGAAHEPWGVFHAFPNECALVLKARIASKRCPCEFPEVEPCDKNCTCRTPVMSGGCERCATHGSYEQQVAKARHLANVLNAYDFRKGPE